MAKQEDDFDLDFESFDDFDFGDPFGDGSSPKDDRSPTTKFAGGFLKGVKETAKKPSLYVDAMRKALPDGYSAAYDVIDDTAGRGIGLYNEVVSDLRPAMRDLKRVMRTAKGAVNAVLPDTLSKKLDEWLKDKEQEQRREQYDPQELKIASDLAEIFKVQAEDKATDDQERLLGQAVESKRHRTQTEQLDEIRISLKQLTGYQDSVNFAYQRKSLELQYRQYYSQRDLLEVTKATSQESVSLLRHIQKNTGLPDIQKTYDSELATRMTKERLYGVIQDRIAPYAREFLAPFFKNVGNRVKEKVSEFKDNVSMVAMGVEQGEDAAAMAEEFGLSKEQLAGEAVGGMGTTWLANWLGKKLRPHLEKNPNIIAGGYKAGHAAENYDLMLKSYLEEETFNSPILQMLQESALDALRIKKGTKVGYDDISLSTERTAWDNLSRKSLVEVIPGFLSRILQSSEGIRTGSEVALTSYDHKTNRFMSTNQIAANINRQAFDEYNLERLGTRSTNIIDNLDPTKSLDEETRRKLQLFLIKQAQQGAGFDEKKFTDDYTLTSAGFGADQAEKIAEAIRNSLEMDYDGKVAFTPSAQKTRRDVARDVRALRELIPSVYEFANVNANTGNRDAVRLSGITRNLRGEDHIDDNFLIKKIEQYLKGELNENTPAETYTDSSLVPTVNSRRSNASFSQMGTASIMEVIQATQQTNKELLAEIKLNSTKPEEPGSFTTEFDRLIATIREESVRHQATEASITLRQILEIVDSMRTDGVIGLSADSPDAQNWQRMRSMGRGAKSFGKKLFSPIKGLWNLGGKLQGGAAGALSSLWTGAKNIGSGLFDPIKERFMDVYVPGVADVKLRADKMRAGEYFDAKTGKVLESIRDIKGAVKDSLGNVVLSAEEYSRGLMTVDGKPLGRKVVGWLSDKAIKGAGFITGNLAKGFNLPFSATAGALKFIKRQLTSSPDVYVLGESTPRLLGSLLRSGHYISAKTRKAVYSVSDIDGDVLDGVTGQVILSIADAQKGLVDRLGKPIRTLLGKLADVGRAGLGMATSAVGWGAKQLVKGFGNVKDLISGGFGALANVGKNFQIGSFQSDPIVNAVDRIYDLLVKYFASQGMSEDEMEATGVFDSDTGDVNLREKPKSIMEKLRDKTDSLKNRAGSWWNQKRQRAEDAANSGKEKVKERVKEAKEKGSGLFGVLGTLLGGVGGSIVSAIKWLGGIIVGKAALGGAADLAGGFGDGPDSKGKKGGKGPKGKAGLLGKVAGGLWSATKWAGRGLLGAGGLALRAVPLVAKGAMMLGSAVASVVSAPVILTAAAVAAVGISGYYAYRYFKDRLDPLQRVRFSQYGIPLEDKDDCVVVGQLEMDAVKSVVWSEGKAVNIDSRFDLVTQMERFGIEQSDNRAVQHFVNWYQNRFKPVYLTHLTVLSKLSPGTALHEADSKLADYAKVTYVKATRFNDGTPPYPYRINTSPFPGKKLVHGREIIDQEIINVIEDNKNAKRPSSQANVATQTKRPDYVPTDTAPSKPTKVLTDRNEFVTKPGPEQTPINKLLSPLGNRSEFVTTPDVIDRKPSDLYDRLTTGNDVEKVGDQPRHDLYNQIPEPKGNGTWDAVKDTLIAAATAVGVDVRKLAMLARLESSFDIFASAKTSSAKGLFQFIASTWRGLMDKFGNKLGIPSNAQPTDPKAAALLAGEFLKQNESQLTKTLGKTPDLTESYLAHFLGSGGSKKLFAADPSALAKDILPQAANANKSIFFNKDSSPRTIEEVIAYMRNKVEGANTAISKAPATVQRSSGEEISITETPDISAHTQSSTTYTPTITAYQDTPKPRGPETPTQRRETTEPPTVMETRERAKREVMQRQKEQQQISIAEAQKASSDEGVQLARRSIELQTSMEQSLRIMVQHLGNIEKITAAEKPAVKIAPVSTSNPAPVARPMAPPTAVVALNRTTR